MQRDRELPDSFWGSWFSALRYRLLAVHVRRLVARRISVMLRVRNEEEYLLASVGSIIDSVDEVVLIDNLSTDATPAIIRSLRRKYPTKVKAHDYPSPIRRVGRENWGLATHRRYRRSPHLASNFYNWCLHRCSGPYILKWDGDMVAVDAFHGALEKWRSGQAAVLLLHGMNVHPDLEHLVTAKETDRVRLLEQLSVPALPRWVTSLTYDYPEPRVFPKLFARYDDRLRWTQCLSSPFIDRGGNEFSLQIAEPCYLHLKFCKREACDNYSPDLGRLIMSNIDRGPALDAPSLQVLSRWHIGVPALGD